MNPRAAKIIAENLEGNHSSALLHESCFEEVSRKIPFDYIDVDPYGTALPYLDHALRFVKNRGTLGITATDLSTLTGSFPNRTARRYGSRIINGPHRHEKGIRLLMAECAKRAAAFDRAIFPMLSFWGGHYYRIFVRVENGAEKADSMLENVGTINLARILGGSYQEIEEGAMWKGALEDREILGRIQSLGKEYPHILPLLDYLHNEDLGLFFLELSDLGRFTKKDVPRTSKIVDLLKEMGYSAGRTHFSPTGVKADMDLKDAFDAVARYMNRQND